MDPDKPLIEQAWDYYFTRENPADLRSIRICVSPEVVDIMAEVPAHFSPRERVHYQEFTANDLLQYAKQQVEDAAEANRELCKAVHANPRRYADDWKALTAIIAHTIEDGTNARRDLIAFTKAVRDIFGVEV